MSEKRRLAQIDRVYASLPKLNCKGLCYEACGPILMSRLEWERLKAVGGEKKGNASLTCPYLVERRCSVYEVRPGVCRLYGLIKRDIMTCPHGCEPERWLSDPEAKAVLMELERLGK